MRYTNLDQLQAAYRTGELTPQTAELEIDNDVVYVYLHDEEWVNVEKVFEMRPDELIEQALDLLGIPHQHV